MAIFSTARDRCTMAFVRSGRDPCPAGPCATRRDALRHFLRGLDQRITDLPAAPRDTAAFRQADLGFDIFPMLVHQIPYARPGGGFFAALGDEDHVTIERDARALQQHHRHHGGS